MSRVDAAQVRESVSISSVIGQATDLRWRGTDLMGCCPLHADRTPSLSVSDEKGLFHCFGCGAGGDVIDFVMLHEGLSFREAVEHIELGAPVIARPMINERVGAQNGTKAAQAIWQSGQPIKRTPVELYLASRCLRLAELPALPAIRFGRSSYRGDGRRHPILIAAVTDLGGAVTGVQRTYLTEEGQKLAVSDPKLSRGAIKGGAIKLGEPAEELIVCEGLEDGLTVLLGLPSSSVWVAAGAGMMAHIRLPDECRIVTIAADNDEAGRRAADEAATAFQRTGRTTRIMSPSHAYKDLNDELRKTQR